MDRKALLLVTFFVEGGLLVLALILMGFSGLSLSSNIYLSFEATVYALLLCLPLLVPLYFVVQSQWRPVVRLRGKIYENVLPIFSNSKIIDFALIAFLAGVGEELFFRGWLQSVLISKYDIWLGLLIASAIFGLLHYISTGYAIYAWLIGLYLGVIFLLTENLYIVMMIHAVYDFIALVYLVEMGGDKKGGLQANG